MSLLVCVAYFANVVTCSVGFRVRGGLLAGTRYQLPGQTARLAFATAAGLAAWVGVPWWLALATVPAWWIASTIPIFGAIDLGTRDGSLWSDVALLTLRGLLWAALPALVLCWPHVTFLSGAALIWTQGAARPWALLIAGLTMPLCYWLGQRSGVRARGIGAGDWCETGEAIYGAALGVGILAAVV